MAEQTWTITGGTRVTEGLIFLNEHISDEVIDGDLAAEVDPTYLVYIAVFIDGRVRVQTGEASNQLGPFRRDDLTSLWETDGQVDFAIGGNTLVVAGPNAPGSTMTDDSEPYEWTPSNSTEVIVFTNALLALPVLDRSGTVTLRDFDPASTSNILIGSDPVDRVYVGSEEVSAIYIGSTKVFG